MAEENSGGSSMPKAPIGVLGALAALAIAGAAYALTSRNGDGGQETPTKQKSGGMRKRLGLMTAIAVIENDTTRKLLLATLKAMAKRA